MNKELNRKRRKYFWEVMVIERKYKMLSQEDVAQKTGISQDIISKIEKGKRRMDVIEMIAYCEALDLSLTELAAKIESRLFAEGVLKRPRKR